MKLVVFRNEWRNPENWEVIRWWERRRILYTLIVGIAGVLSYLVANSIAEVYPQNADDFLKPAFVLVGVPFLVIVANICYTFGWMIELALRKKASSRRFRAIAFYAEVVFSVIIMSLPVWFVVVSGFVERLAEIYMYTPAQPPLWRFQVDAAETRGVTFSSGSTFKK
jgi:hypothetical protein